MQLFGQPTLSINGKPTEPLRTRKGFWLLALLALRHGRDVERSWLAGTLWADSEESQALYNLRRSLSDLRRVLGAEACCIAAPTPHTLRLVVEVGAIDVAEFDAALKRGDAASLDKAIALYQGRLLEGCLEEWAFAEAEARERAYLNALQTQASRALAEGDSERAENLARQVIAVDFTEETAWRLLLTALARQGNSAALTSAYRDLRIRLQRDYNLSPDPQTAALFERLRTESRSREMPQSVAPLPSAQKSSSPVSAGVPPRPLTTLIGRDTHTLEVAEVLHSHRLVTLTGSGGVGKTRLALAAAEEIRANSPNEVRFVNMAALHDPRLVAAHVALSLDLREQAEIPLETTLCQWLAPRSMVLVLDNCEHLLEACAALIERLLAGTENLTVLATSRIALGIAGELIWRVPSLKIPPVSRALTQPLDSETLLTYSAVRLFVERAQNYRPDFRLEQENAASVAAICRQLDGIPLALELAAARIRHLAPAEIAHRLENAITLLKAGSRTELRRWQTLRASIEWSWSLLTPQEQSILTLLSVFAGGFTLEAAEAVCAGIPLEQEPDKDKAAISPHNLDGVFQDTEQHIEKDDVVDVLGALIDHSLILYPDLSGQHRYRLPETIRQYASERLQASGSEEAVRRRHLEWCLAFAEKNDALNPTEDQAAVLERLEQEHDNFRAGFAWRPSSDKEGILKLRLAAMLWWFWYVRGYYQEGRSHMEEALLALRKEVDCLAERADVLNGIGNLAVVQGDSVAAQQAFQECLVLRQEIGDKSGMGAVFGNLGILATSCLHYAEAQEWYEKALAIAEEFDDVNKICGALNGLARIAAHQRAFERAQTYFEQILAFATAQNNATGIMITLQNLASVAEEQEDYPRARSLFAQALAKAHLLGNRRCVATLLEALAGIAVIVEPECDSKTAAFLGAARALREQIGSPVPIEQQVKYEGIIACLQKRMGAEAFETALAHGRSMEREAVLALALENAAAKDKEVSLENG